METLGDGRYGIYQASARNLFRLNRKSFKRKQKRKHIKSVSQYKAQAVKMRIIEVIIDVRPR